MNDEKEIETILPEDESLIDLEDMEDEELPPPEEENEAREINVGNIFAVILIGILILFLIAFIAVNANSKKKTKTDNSELDKAGVKTHVNFDLPETSILPIEYSIEEEVEKENEIEEIINSLPPELQLPEQGQPGIAPVTSVGNTGSSSSYTVERPDTRNSKSPRKIEGLAGLEYGNQTSVVDTISSVMNGTYSSTKMTKEEYIAQQMAQTQSIQNQLYGNGSNMGSDIGSNKENFFNNNSGTVGNGYYMSKSSLWDGTIISAALVTSIDTANPGVVIARVTENVYSSYDHSYLLIPEGSMLFATYNSSVSYGQNRVQVAWNLLIRPDNYRIQLGNMNGVDSQGASGYEGRVNNHTFETLKAMGMIAMFSIIQTEVTNTIDNQSNEYIQNSLTDVYAEASKIGNKILDRVLDIQPTIKIGHGKEIKLITNGPLELPPVEVNQVTQKYVRTR